MENPKPYKSYHQLFNEANIFGKFALWLKHEQSGYEYNSQNRQLLEALYYETERFPKPYGRQGQYDVPLNTNPYTTSDHLQVSRHSIAPKKPYDDFKGFTILDLTKDLSKDPDRREKVAYI